MIPKRIGDRYAEDFFIGAFFVEHLETADRFGGDHTAGESRFPDQDKGIERIGIFGECFGDEAKLDKYR